MTINQYMNLKMIDGRKVLAVKDVHRVLMSKFQEISKDIRIIGMENLDKKGKLNLIVHYEIPSETYKEIKYIVILHFIADSKTIDGNTSIKILSNSPNFGFTYAFVFNKAKLLVNEYKESILNRLQLTKKPRITNPKMLLGIDKSIFYAINYTSFIKHTLTNTSKNIRPIYKHYPTSDDMVILTQKMKKKQGDNKQYQPYEF